MRVLVIGGRGFWGGHIAKALAEVEGVEVDLGGRSASGTARFDITDAATFSNLSHYGCAINAADTVDHSPLPLIEYVLAHDHTLIETAADPATLERVFHAARRPGTEQPAHRGRVILGMGFMPGVTNL